MYLFPKVKSHNKNYVLNSDNHWKFSNENILSLEAFRVLYNVPSLLLQPNLESYYGNMYVIRFSISLPWGKASSATFLGGGKMNILSLSHIA